MKRIFESRLFLILSAPINAGLGIWTGVAVANGVDATLPLLLLVGGFLVSVVNTFYQILEK